MNTVLKVEKVTNGHYAVVTEGGKLRSTEPISCSIRAGDDTVIQGIPRL